MAHRHLFIQNVQPLPLVGKNWPWKMTMSLFHNLKLKRRKVDSRSSSDGSETAATDMISPPSLASSSEVSSELEHSHRPHSRQSAFEVEVKAGGKSELSPPRYTTWASPAKLKQEPIYGDETISATVVPKSLANGNSLNGRPTTTMTMERHRLADALRADALRPDALRPAPGPVVTTIAHHLPLAAAAAAAKLQALHPQLAGGGHPPPMSSSIHPHPALRMMMPSQQQQHQHQQQPVSLHQMTSKPPPVASIAPVKTEPLKISAAPNGVPPTSVNTPPPGVTNNGPRKNGPSVILGEHGGVKTMIWTDSTTYWQSANKYRPAVPPQPSSMAASPPTSQVPPIPTSSPHEPVHGRCPPLPLPPLPGLNPPPVSLKVERPDHEQLKMSSAVDGLLSLSSQGRRPSPHNIMQMSPVHPPHSSSPATAPTSSPSTDLKMGPFVTQPCPPSGTPPIMGGPQTQPPPRRRSPMNMERLWAGDMSQLPAHVLESQNGHVNLGLRPNQDPEDEEPLLCNICEDRATGLHYGIITCEG